MSPLSSLSDWTIAKLEEAKECDCLIVRDPLRLLPEGGGIIHNFGKENNFSVITASTNLVFRELYHRSREDKTIEKLLLIDRAPLSRKGRSKAIKSPPILYPDILERTPQKGRINLDLRQYLQEVTRDPEWPKETNEPAYARLIVRHLEEVLRAHSNLRTFHSERFTDKDLKTIVTYAVLGIPDYAFKRLDAEAYWKMSLLDYEVMENLESLSPDITAHIREELSKAPPPFSWFAQNNPEIVTTTFYLSVILAQHCDDWNLLLTNIDPHLIQPEKIGKLELISCAEALIKIDNPQAHLAIQQAEDRLTSQNLSLLLIDHLKMDSKEGYLSVLEHEHFSSLIRSLCLIMALDNLLSQNVEKEVHEKIAHILFDEEKKAKPKFVDTRTALYWSNLREAWRLMRQLRPLYDGLFKEINTLKMLKAEELTFSKFRTLWNEKKTNRMEYYLSTLERLISSGNFLPRSEKDLPSLFSNALARIRERIRQYEDGLQLFFKELNLLFQKYIVAHYAQWIKKDDEVYLTSQFLRRVLKPNWDPEHEHALVLIFDGMRYDIWDELMRPVVEEQLELIKDYPAISLIPSETHITRKAISAGSYPDDFSTSLSEDKLLAAGLKKEFKFKGEVSVHEYGGTGEVVRYKAGNLDMIIFELCDKELHGIDVKVKDGREIPSRPLSFIYDQHIKNIINTEVLAIIRELAPGTKVFILADHGFTKVPRDKLSIEERWVNDPFDCNYLNARLAQPVKSLSAPEKMKSNIWEFSPKDLRMPVKETDFDKKAKCTREKIYESFIFPKAGYVFSRPGAHFKPFAYGHGGISLQELMIPMIVLKVKPKEKGALTIYDISAPTEFGESEEIEFRLRLIPTAGKKDEPMRVDIEAVMSSKATSQERELAKQICFVPSGGYEFVSALRIAQEDATDDERLKGAMERTLTITVSYREGHHMTKRSRSHSFTVRLNNERVIRRVPTSLGNILGLMPKR